MLSSQAAAPAMQHAVTHPVNPDEIRPLGPLSNMACSGRLGGLIRSIELQEPEDRTASHDVIAQDMERKIEALDPKTLSALPEREKRVAALDLRLNVHALRAIGAGTGRSPNDSLLDKARTLLTDNLDVRAKGVNADPLHLELEELLKASPSRDPRGLDHDMRREVAVAGGRTISFVLEDIYQYPTLLPFVSDAELASRRPARGGQDFGISGTRGGW